MKRLRHRLGALLRQVVIRAVRFYQGAISPLIAPRCRFQPTCSEYLIQAVNRHGLIIGLARGAWRICRCHPLSRGGYDPP